MILVRWMQNRVLLGLFLFFTLVGVYEFRWKPQYKPMYEGGISDYRAGRYRQALDQLQRAYAISPNAVNVIMMLGWTELKLHHYEEARFYFDRALRIDPRTEEARVGASFVAVETGRGELNVQLLAKILDRRKGDPNLRVLVASALANDGKEYDAASMFRDLVDDRHYFKTARSALEQLYGTEGFEQDKVTEAQPPVRRALQLQQRFRAAEGRFWRQQGGAMQPYYVAGVDFSPGAPGYYPGSPPLEGSRYAEWLRNAGDLHANVIRTYTLLPPAFYRAYRHHLDGGGNLILFQQIWVPEPPARDLFDARFMDDTRAEIRYVIDALHGRGEVPSRRNRSGGIYDLDVADHVGAILFGGDFDAGVTARTGILHVEKTAFDGRYLAIQNASAAEVWYTQMLDYAISYETLTYNWQHPVALVNVLSADPLHNPTEARLQAKPGFTAGLFAAYNAYPFFPEVILRDPQLLKAADREGPNSVYGYLKDLRARIPYPLLASEFGMPSSIGVGRFQAYGWNEGGHTEAEQAEILLRLHRGVRESGCAGELVYELLDEWHRHGWPREGFATPADHEWMWLNDADPADRYGLIGFHTSKWKLFTGDADAWSAAEKLNGIPSRATDPALASDAVLAARVAGDEGYLYLRLDLGCNGCPPPSGKALRAAYAIAFSTLPNRSGIRRLPFGGVTLPHAANFLAYLQPPSDGQLLVAQNYNPYQAVPVEEGSNDTQVIFRRGFMNTVQATGEFNKLAWQPRKLPNGTPVGDYSLSGLHYGNGNPGAPDYNSSAEWYYDAGSHAILLRIPWAKLLVTDPSGAQVLFGYADPSGIRITTSTGIEISIFTLQPSKGALASATVVSSFPAMHAGRIDSPPSFVFVRWDSVKADPYFKKAYYALQQVFSAPEANPPVPSTPARRAALDPAKRVR